MTSPLRTALRPAPKQTYIHATAVVIGTAGILIRGPSRAGKSSLALALLAEAAQNACFARLIGDDRIGVARQGEDLILRGHPAILGKIEQRGEGILDVAWEPFAIAAMVVDLAAFGAEMAPDTNSTHIEGVALPLISLRFGQEPRDRARLVLESLRNFGAGAGG